MRRFTLLFLCECTFLMQAFADTTDVFPLRRGLRCSYQYNHEYYQWIYGYYSDANDSGTVTYFVLDSANTDDTTITWQIREVQHLLHRVFSYPSFDTTYSTSDSSTFFLTESINGNHELRSASLLWRFPLFLQFWDSTHVYRYADTSHLLLSRPASWCMRIIPPLTENTALLTTDSGLTRMQRFICSDNDETGSYDFTKVTLVSRTFTDVHDLNLPPIQFTLLSNYPNPFNSTTAIVYNLPRMSDVVLSVHDILGNLIARWVQDHQPPGHHAYSFDGSNLASGLYVVRLQASGRNYTNKMILLK